MKSTLKKQIIAWCFYDFANSAFPTIILTVAFGIYFKAVVVPDPSKGDWLWGLTLSISFALTCLCGPLLGTLSDTRFSKKSMLIFFSLICSFATAMLYGSAANTVLWSAGFLILANFSFSTALIFYNAYLPILSPKEHIGKISGWGWALGYMGGLLCLLICYDFIKDGYALAHQAKYKLSFLITSGFYLFFALPAFILLKEPNKITLESNLGYRKLFRVYKEISQHPTIGRFLLAYFFFNDGITTIVLYAGIYAVSTLSFSMQDVMILFLFLQVCSFFGAAIFGYLADWKPPKKVLQWTLVFWMFNIMAAFFSQTKIHFWITAACCGLVIGATQSTARTLMGILSPKEKRGAFFGLFAFCGKFSAIIGPLLFGWISSHLGGERWALISVFFFFLLGWIILKPLKTPPFIESNESID